jgi:hypothetical protein
MSNDALVRRFTEEFKNRNNFAVAGHAPDPGVTPIEFQARPHTVPTGQMTESNP